MAERTMLQFDYEEVHGQTVTGVVGHTDDPAGWGTIALVIEHRAIVIRVDPDTDELIVSLEGLLNPASGWIEVAELAHAVGSPLGWCWIGRNYLGYLDMFTLSLSGISPHICFVGEASTLTIRHIGEGH